jgi:hypothetical protein
MTGPDHDRPDRVPDGGGHHDGDGDGGGWPGESEGRG